MSNKIEVSQKAALGSGNTQIAVQNNYTGLSPQEAAQLAMDLFWENFPKLQQAAAEIAKARAEELCEGMMDKLAKNNYTDFSVFSEPDMQYVLYKAQKNYARTGTKDMLDALTTLIFKRMSCNDDFALKVVIDEAISIAPFLSQQHLDYLSLLFICKRVKFSGLKDIAEFDDFSKRISSAFAQASDSCVSFLNSLGCLELDINDIYQSFASSYGLDENEVKAVCPKILDVCNGDYAPSLIGIILAIVNAEAKTEFRFNPHIWIHG